jgi:hypothetical protein
MFQLKTEQNTFLRIDNEYDEVLAEQVMLFAKSSYGKSLATEAIAEEYHKAGYTIIIIHEPKAGEIEWGYSQFLPKKKYHLDGLRAIGKKPEAHKVKIYSPFTFRIPKEKIPDFNFFTLSLKDLGTEEFSMLAETEYDSDTLKLLNKATEDISNEDGLLSFLHYVQDLTEGKRDSRRYKPDWRNFGLSVSAGTAKSVQDIANYFHPFEKDYFLAKENCPLNLDIKKILQDQESYHVFVTNFLNPKNKKIKEFITLAILNKIVNNVQKYAKTPVLIVIPEIRFLVPFKPEGYKKFLAEGIKSKLSIMRNMGKGVGSLSDSQVFSDTDEDVRNSATVTLFGELAPSDSDKVSKTLNYKREIRELFLNMQYKNSYLMVGKEDVGQIKIWLPSARHCEQEYNFFETFKEEYPERMKSFSDVIDMMKKIVKEEEDKIKDKIKKKEQREKERDEEIRKIKEENSKEKIQSEKKINKASSMIEKSKMELMRLIYEYKNKNKDKSWRAIGEEFKLHHKTAKKYYEQYEEELKNKAENPVINGAEEKKSIKEEQNIMDIEEEEKE